MVLALVGWGGGGRGSGGVLRRRRQRPWMRGRGPGPAVVVGAAAVGRACSPGIAKKPTTPGYWRGPCEAPLLFARDPPVGIGHRHIKTLIEAMWHHDPTMRPNIGTVVRMLKEIALKISIPHDQARSWSTNCFGLELEVTWKKFRAYVTAGLNQKRELIGAVKKSPLGIGRDLTAKQFYNLAQCLGSFPVNQAHFIAMVTLCNQIWFAGSIGDVELRRMLHSTPGSLVVRKSCRTQPNI
ncbi:hypothetical protein Pelo_14383 [Pelomyxa schiedti]|nr:hypothetical protein Pelo_14383 [Pelomyxa schiedti]